MSAISAIEKVCNKKNIPEELRELIFSYVQKQYPFRCFILDDSRVIHISYMYGHLAAPYINKRRTTRRPFDSFFSDVDCCKIMKRNKIVELCIRKHQLWLLTNC